VKADVEAIENAAAQAPAAPASQSAPTNAATQVAAAAPSGLHSVTPD